MESNIFKAYDVRGIYPTELNEESAFKLGQATAIFLKARILIVGEDARISSPSLRQKLVEGIISMGCNVIHIGQCTTPLFYLSVSNLKADGGVMITASHNPAEYNGLKIVGMNSMPICAENGLMEIKKIADVENLESSKKGSIKEKNLVSEYINLVLDKSGILKDKAENLKVVIDAGNGMAPVVLGPLLKQIPIKITRLFFNIDGTFPGRSPDTSKAENLKALISLVITEKADLGVAFDGDGDRVVMIDGKGNIIDAEYLLALIYLSSKSFFKNPTVAYDLRISKSVKDLMASQGTVSRTGHAFIKMKMREHSIDLGGELSGHFFFKEMNYAESAILVMLKILDIMAKQKKPIAELIASFQKYFKSREINIQIASKEEALKIIDALTDKYKNEKIDRLDGISVDVWDKEGFWFNLRASNTEPIVRLVVEAKTKELMEQKVNELTADIKNTAS